MPEVDRRSYWQVILQNQIASGVPVVRWCKSEGVNVHTFRHWRSRLLNPETRAVPTLEPTAALQPRADWTEVNTSSAALKIPHHADVNGHVKMHQM